MKKHRPFTEEDWQATPEPVRKAFEFLEQQVEILTRRLDELENRINKNSGNSNKPPSSDNPFKKNRKRKTAKKRSGAKKGHKGHTQKRMMPTEIVNLKPECCPCGNRHFPKTKPFYIHQVIELPEIKMDVTHFHLHSAICPKCGVENRAELQPENRAGFGPRLTALIGDLAGNHGNSRSSIQEFCDSILNFHISLGAVQNVIDRASQAIEPHYETIGAKIRRALKAHIDETSFPKNGDLEWLWVMANDDEAFFKIHPNRSKEAFEALIEKWNGILISDDYGVYQKWTARRQTCLAHLIRRAKGLRERKDPDIARFGIWCTSELQRLCNMAKKPPTQGEWNAFYARLCRLIGLYRDEKNDAGRMARRLDKEIESLFVFLDEEGVDPTNNHAERMLRYAVIWRKRSQGTESTKGQRWVERILTLRHTCRLRVRKLFPVLVNAVQCFFKELNPDLAWISE